MSGGSGGGKDVTTTSNSVSEPPAYAQGNVKQLLEGARLQYEGATPEFFPGQTYVTPSSETQTGLSGITGQALSGSPISGLGEQEYLKTLRGDYTNPTTNPGYSSMVEGIKANVLPGIDSRYISAGRTGGGLHGRAVGEGLGSAIGGLTYQNYETERGRQDAAARSAPQYAATRYDDYNKLLQTGAAKEAQQGDVLQDTLARYDFGQNRIQNKLNAYGANIGQGVFGSNTSQTQTTPYFKGGNAATGALGGAASGAAIGTAISPGYGTAIGAGAGALAGGAGSK